MNGATTEIDDHRIRNGHAGVNPATAGQMPSVEEAAAIPSISDCRRNLNYLGYNLFNLLGEEVVGQKEMRRALVMALIGDMTIAIVGDSSTGKTFGAEALGRACGVKTHLMAMHPETTHADINGYNMRDLKTGLIRYEPSPFLTSSIVVLDEFNRAGNKGRASTLKVLKDKLVIVGNDAPRPVGDDVTCIMAMNAPGTDGTQDLMDPLIDRIDLVVQTRTPTRGEMDQGLERAVMRRAGKFRQTKTVFDEAKKEAEKQGRSFDPVATIVQARKAFNRVLDDVDQDVRRTVTYILDHFNDPQPAPDPRNPEQTVLTRPWQTSTRGHRKPIAMLAAATALAVIDGGTMPTPGHVWKVAPMCLGLLKHEDMSLTYGQTTEQMRARVGEMKRQAQKASSF